MAGLAIHAMQIEVLLKPGHTQEFLQRGFFHQRDLAKTHVLIHEREDLLGVVVGKTEAAFAQEVGEWCEMSSTRGLLVACTFEHLVTALRFLIVQRRIQEIRDILPEVDAATILSEIGAIRTSLKKITNIKTQVNAVIEGAETIRTEAEALREEINSALTTIERAIHLVKEKEQPKKLAARAAAG